MNLGDTIQSTALGPRRGNSCMGWTHGNLWATTHAELSCPQALSRNRHPAKHVQMLKRHLTQDSSTLISVPGLHALGGGGANTSGVLPAFWAVPSLAYVRRRDLSGYQEIPQTWSYFPGSTCMILLLSSVWRIIIPKADSGVVPGEAGELSCQGLLKPGDWLCPCPPS